jgi:hypothetical protein
VTSREKATESTDLVKSNPFRKLQGKRDEPSIFHIMIRRFLLLRSYSDYHRTDLEEVEPITLLCCEEQKALQATEEIFYIVPRS